MNEEINSQPQAGKGMNSMMIVGAVIVIALIGFFVIRSTAQEPANDAASTNSSNEIAGEEDTTTETRLTDDEALTTGDGPVATDTASDTAMEETDGDVQVIKMEAGSFYYKPETITIKKGQKVRLEMTSVDMMHDFNIDELGVKLPIVKSGDTGTVEFVADTVGEFEFYCSVGQHRTNGQVGTLIVE
jgi:plastocyanin